MLQDHDSLVTLSANDITVAFRKADATIARVQKGKEGVEVPLTDGPLPVGMKMEFTAIRSDGWGRCCFLCPLSGWGRFCPMVYVPSGLLSMDAVLLNRASGGGGFDDAFMDEAVLNLGFTFLIPSRSVPACAGWDGALIVYGRTG